MKAKYILQYSLVVTACASGLWVSNNLRSAKQNKTKECCIPQPSNLQSPPSPNNGGELQLEHPMWQTLNRFIVSIK
ncbi:MAG: hypothetical protein J0I41_16780 [Filimonas sp.]|nr:hypothetical protein [Filimonas sp.]